MGITLLSYNPEAAGQQPGERIFYRRRNRRASNHGTEADNFRPGVSKRTQLLGCRTGNDAAS
ncbi:hypothetical protein C9418_15525 [Rhizobium sp. SEMIA 4032]|nr:hypothetical protein C9418_15525 [Rhizobium sp. SEMIA 4032]